MKPRAFELVPAAALSAVLIIGVPAAWAWHGTIWPYTSDAYATEGALQQAVLLDHSISCAWGPNNRALGGFYGSKARDAQRLLMRLRNSEPVSSVEVERALDNRGASRLGGEYWNVPDGPTHY